MAQSEQGSGPQVFKIDLDIEPILDAIHRRGLSERLIY
jgi:hypothetical protein